MQKEYNNKMMNGERVTIKTQENAAVEDYHFSGGGEYEPMTLSAKSREEAEAAWKARRKPLKVETLPAAEVGASSRSAAQEAESG